MRGLFAAAEAWSQNREVASVAIIPAHLSKKKASGHPEISTCQCCSFQTYCKATGQHVKNHWIQSERCALPRQSSCRHCIFSNFEGKVPILLYFAKFEGHDPGLHSKGLQAVNVASTNPICVWQCAKSVDCPRDHRASADQNEPAKWL